MKYYEIDHAVHDIVSQFEEAGYTLKTITEHKRNIQKVVDLHHKQGTYIYSPEIVENYILELKELYGSGAIGRNRKNALMKAALYVREMASTGMITVGARELTDRLSSYYRKILENVRCSTSWSEALNRNIIYAAHTYFLYLMDSNIPDISHITEAVIRRYIMQKALTMTAGSLNTTRRNLRHLHRWLYENENAESDFSDILSFTTPPAHRIKKPVPHDEIAKVFRAIDKETAIGKRDYAMFMIAVVTGMRSIDIASLKFSAIDWISGEIRIPQKKTGMMLALPLTKDIGEALKDYILSGRPQNDTDFVFLTSRPPIKPLGRRAIYSAFNHVRNAAGLGKCPFHGLRRTAGTGMATAGIPVTTIAQVLGHSDVSSTKQYISLDSVHLRECAIGLDGISRLEAEHESTVFQHL